jgi:hypothetical protein
MSPQRPSARTSAQYTRVPSYRLSTLSTTRTSLDDAENDDPFEDQDFEDAGDEAGGKEKGLEQTLDRIGMGPSLSPPCSPRSCSLYHVVFAGCPPRDLMGMCRQIPLVQPNQLLFIPRSSESSEPVCLRCCVLSLNQSTECSYCVVWDG